MKDSPILFISESPKKLLLNNYNPFAINPNNGFLFAGIGEDNNWYSDTALGGSDILTKALMNQKLYSEFFRFIKENQETSRLIPWFQFNKPTLNDDVKRFVRENLVSLFPDMLIMKPKTTEIKKYLEPVYYVQQKGTYRVLENKFIDISKFDMKGIENSNKMLEQWIKSHTIKTIQDQPEYINLETKLQ